LVTEAMPVAPVNIYYDKFSHFVMAAGAFPLTITVVLTTPCQ